MSAQADLRAEIRVSRKLEIKVRDMVFFARRPTYEELGDLASLNLQSNPKITRQIVTGWKNVRASDLFVDGTDEFIEFDKELWSEALSDLPDVCAAIAEHAVQESVAYQKRREENRKNSLAG